jgi:hypothetical protein
MIWDQGKIEILKVLDNKWTRAIDFGFRVKEGYIIEFFVDYNNSFSKTERKFTEGLRKWILEEIPLWIKMLFMKKGLFHMEIDRMVE